MSSGQDDSPEGLTAPGGPQRQDAPDSGLGGQDTGVDRESADSQEDEHGSTIPVDEEQSHPEPDQEDDTQADSAQEENAESSLDQPSNG